MAAPSLPHLNSSRSTWSFIGIGPRAGMSGRDSGRPSRHMTEDDADYWQRRIQLTDSDASGSRLSAVNLRYLSDPYAGRFWKGKEPRRFPIINRGTYVRTSAIDRLVRAFLDTQPGRQKQVVSLGAGTDTRFFRLAAEYPSLDLVYHEIDLPGNTTSKIEVMKNDAGLMNLINHHVGHLDPVVFGDDGASLLSKVYNIHPLDLRTMTVTDPPTMPNLNPDIPTLILSECCLMYLSPKEGNQILDTFLHKLLSRTTPIGIIIYEPIKPNDAFGRTMISNLAARGLQLQTIQQFEDLQAQRSRLKAVGFSGLQFGADVEYIWKEWISGEEKERISRCEMLDEVEEWQLLASHYCLVWGAREDNAGQQAVNGIFATAWTEVANQNDT